MSKDVKDTEAQEELKDKVNAGDVKEEKETKEKHAKAKKASIDTGGSSTPISRPTQYKKIKTRK